MSQLVGLMIPSIVAFLLIRDYAYSLIKYNLGKNKYIQFKSELGFRNGLFLIGFRDLAKKKNKNMFFCCAINKIYLVVFILFFPILTIYWVFPVLQQTILIIFICKTVIVDCFVLIFELLHSKSKKSGGVFWDHEK